METTLSLLFHLSYFTLSSLTHKTTLHKIMCRKANVAYLMGRREYILDCNSLKARQQSTTIYRLQSSVLDIAVCVTLQSRILDVVVRVNLPLRIL